MLPCWLLDQEQIDGLLTGMEDLEEPSEQPTPFGPLLVFSFSGSVGWPSMLDLFMGSPTDVSPLPTVLCSLLPLDGAITGRIAQNTILSAAAGALVALCIQKIHKKNWDLYVLINGILSGMVAATCGSALVHSWAAFVMGCVSAMLYYPTKTIMDWLHIDDALDAIAIHWVNGWWSAIGMFWFLPPPLLTVP